MFHFNMEPRLKWNKNVLTAKAILFHFKTWFHAKIKQDILKFFKMILF